MIAESATALTGRERVNRTFERRDTDRIPHYDSFWGETLKRWQGEGLAGGRAEVHDMLAVDFHDLGWCWPKPFPGGREVLEESGETQVVRDEWGGITRVWKSRSGTPEHLGFGCTTPEEWHATYRPALEREGAKLDLDEVRRRHAEGRRKGRWCFLTGVETFEGIRKLIGDEVAMMAMVTDPEWIRDISRLQTDILLSTFQTVVDAGVQPDGIWIYGDMAYNHSTICSPAMYRDLIWPDHKRLADWAHARDMKFIFHTDGDVRGVLDLYLEAGFDCLQPLEAKAGMDITQLCPRYGDRLGFFGNIDVMAMITNDRETIEGEITRKFSAGMATRGYCYHSDHSVPPQVSWETYQFIMELVDRFGRYD